jgi:hypothetical protein
MASFVKSAIDSGGSALATVRNEADGTVRVTFNVKVVGALKMRVRLNGINVRGSPFNLTVFPLDLIPSAAKRSLSSSTLPSSIAGFASQVKLTIRNHLGVGMFSGNNVSQVFSSLTLGSVSVLVRQIGVAPSVVNIGYLANVAGRYKFEIRIGANANNAQHIVGSPFTLVVSPSFSNPEGSFAGSDGIKNIVAGRTGNFSIEARDQFSNIQDPSKAAESLACIITSPSGAGNTNRRSRCRSILRRAIHSYFVRLI